MKKPTKTTENETIITSSTEKLQTVAETIITSSTEKLQTVAKALTAAERMAQHLKNPITAMAMTAIVGFLTIAYVVSKLT